MRTSLLPRQKFLMAYSPLQSFNQLPLDLGSEMRSVNPAVLFPQSPSPAQSRHYQEFVGIDSAFEMGSNTAFYVEN